MPRAVMFPTCPRYVSSLPPSLSCSLFVALAAFEFVWRRRHWPLDSDPFPNSESRRYSDPDAFASALTYALRDGFACAHCSNASDQNAAAVAFGRASNRQKLLAFGRHFDGWHRARCRQLRLRADG